LCDEADKAKDLYDIYKQRLKKYILDKVIPNVSKKQGNSQEFLKEYCKQWDQWTLLVLAMKKMFDYLDRYFLKNGQERNPHLVETALIIFKE
jgi:cullin 1